MAYKQPSPIIVAEGGTGATTLTSNGILLGNGTSAISASSALTNGQLLIGSTGVAPVAATLTGSSNISVTEGAGTITLDLTSNVIDTVIAGWNGSLVETAAITVSSDGATITLSVEQSGGGDLTAVFSDGFYAWDTTPADTVTLTAGTDTAPQVNYVYLLQSTKTLTAATAGWPATEHAPIATVYCESAATVQTKGPYFQQNWTDHITGTNNQGHIGHLNFWVRQQRATWASGVAQTYTITPNGGAPDNVTIETTQGVVLQLHEQTFPAFSNPIDYYVVNDSVTPYTIVTDLNALLTDSAGVSMSGKYFSLVLWGSASQTGSGNSKLFINLPGGSYNTQTDLEDDVNNYSNYTIPNAFKSTGFLISEWKLRHQTAASGTWTSIDEIDLRGQIPGRTAGGGTAVPTEFADDLFRIYDDGDDSKKIAFQASGITTGNTRTITMIDGNLDLNTVANSFPTDSGTAAPTANALTIAGGAGCSTTGAATTVTIDVVGGGLTWNETTVTGPTAMTSDNGYIANNAATVAFTLPTTAALGSVVRITGKGAGGWSLGQSAGQTIYFGTSATTTGAGGSLASTDDKDSIELVCVTANTDFNVLSSIGNITVV